MRTSSRGTKVDSAFMTLAVVGPKGRGVAAAQKLHLAGLAVVDDLWLARQRSDGAMVLHAVAAPTEDAVALHQESRQLLTANGVAPRASFQPIWSIWPRLGPLGFELLVVDDDDASQQLDLFHEAFANETFLAGSKRSHVTIAPRTGWQGYGRS
jgi:hypothetical protein